MSRRKSTYVTFSIATKLSVFACAALVGAAAFGAKKEPEKTETPSPNSKLVADIAVPFGLYPVKIEAISIVTGLPGTGSDPAPSPQRTALLDEMQTRGVTNPNAILASGKTSLVLVQGYLRPGIQKGDRFDVEIRVQSQSETTSLRGGYLMETRLQEMAVLGGSVREGKLLAKAEGDVLVDPTIDLKKEDPNKDRSAITRVMATRGRVLGGGVATKSRPMGLVIIPDYRSVATASRIENAINRRFHTYDNGMKIGVAKAKTDQYVELIVHPRYKDNIARYAQVVRAVALSETAAERMDRIKRLKEEIYNPETAAVAALQLEALGPDGTPILFEAIKSPDVETRFYAAEALAYLDKHEAAEPLGQIARDEPAFRVYALTALSSMQDVAAYDELRKMLASPSAETRYGAFRALWTMNRNDGFVAGEQLGDQFHYHVLDVAGPEMVHVTRSRLSEVTLFGKNQRFNLPVSVNAGPEIMINSTDTGEIAVSKFSVRQSDQKRTVSTRVDDVIRAVVELGGSYPDVVQALQEAKATNALASRFEVDSMPEAGRTYERVAANANGVRQAAAVEVTAASPTPELYAKKVVSYDTKGLKLGRSAEDDEAAKEKAKAEAEKKKSIFSKWFKRDKEEDE